MKVAGIDAHLEIARFFLNTYLRPAYLHGLAELAEKIIEPVAQCQSAGLRRFATRQLQDIIDNCTDAFGVVTNDVSEATLVSSDLWTFSEQLTGVTHGADGIANFVRNAGRQSS